MHETLQQIQREAQKANQERRFERQKTKLTRQLSTRELNERAKIEGALRQALTGKRLTHKEIVDKRADTYLKKQYSQLGRYCRHITESAQFFYLVTAVIIVAGITVGLEVESKVINSEPLNAYLTAMQYFVPLFFLGEAIIKIVACGLDPHLYFRNSWNCFDFLVLIAAYIPMPASWLVPMLRLMRLLKILQGLKSQPALKVTIGSLLNGLAAIASIMLVTCLVFYLFAVLGIALFRTNGRRHDTAPTILHPLYCTIQHPRHLFVLNLSFWQTHGILAPSISPWSPCFDARHSTTGQT
jgi:hypothetical protein